jgi:hypothetical protein
MLVSPLVYYSTLKTESTYSSETWLEFSTGYVALQSRKHYYS